MSTDLIDPDYALAWRRAVEATTRDVATDMGVDPQLLLTDTRFIESLQSTVDDGLDPDEQDFADAVTEAVDEFCTRVLEAEAAADPDRVTEAVDRTEARVLEAKGTDTSGGRVYRVQILKYGTSRNGNRYTEAVMRRAAPLYEGAKAYDHHRTPEELRTSTLSGLVGSYRNVQATADGLYGDLHLLPGATHVAEALDATIAAQAAGRPALVGISHDVQASFKAAEMSGGRRVREAVAITAVQSTDVVAEPSAGGQAVHTVESYHEESEVPVTKADVLAAISTASDGELAAVGLSRTGTTESVTPPERVVESRTTEAGGAPKHDYMTRLMIRGKVEDAGLPAAVAESLAAELPDRVTEADVDARIASLKATAGVLERAGLTPTVSVTITREAVDKKRDALDAFFGGDYLKGYSSFRAAWADVTGYRGNALDLADVNRRILRESFGLGYNSVDRTTESLTSSSWDVILGDSVTRRMVAAYAHPSLQNWRQIVSSIVPVADFRTQRIDRLGGYGTLPAVNQGQPYQPLTSPGDEEVTYAVTKRGGTEDLTMEMIANDDVRAIGNIPTRLGLAAARTLHNFVWDFLSTNPTIYDSVALFHSSHTNTTAVALSQTNLSTLRQKMRDQTAYGDTSDILSLVPRYLIVPNELEELAYQLCTSAVAIPATPAGPTDTPNLHQGMSHIVVDYFTDANDWYVSCDPSMCPTIEIGFYNGQQQPELFTQSDQTVGSMFNADKLTYKIRHIYSGAVLEYRGLQRGTQ